MDVAVDIRHVEETFHEPHLTSLTSASPTDASVLDVSSYPSSVAVNTYPSDSLHHHHHGHYYPEFEWSQTSAAAAAAAAAASDPSHAYYSFAAAERPEVTGVQLYHAFSGVPSADLYSNPSSLWHGSGGLADDTAAVSALPVQRFLPAGAMPRTATSAASTSASNAANVKPKRKRVQSHAQRRAANIRERRRMFHLNTAFDELRKRLPAFNYEKRLSRIETLRLAMTYIAFMKDVMMGEDPRKVKLRANGTASDGGSDLSGMDLESCASDDAHADDDDDDN